MKGKSYVFSGDKQRKNLFFVCLDFELQQERYGEWIF